MRINIKCQQKPYITAALKNSIKEKHRLERLSQKWPITYRERYRTYRNKLTTVLRAAKNQYHKDKLKQTQGNPKSHWKSINEILGRNHSTSDNHKIELQPPCSNIADKFNEHFLRYGTSVTSAAFNHSHKKYLTNPPPFSMYVPISYSFC